MILFIYINILKLNNINANFGLLSDFTLKQKLISLISYHKIKYIYAYMCAYLRDVTLNILLLYL